MNNFRNVNEFVNRAGSRAKTLRRRVQNVLSGNKSTTRISMTYLDTLVGPGLLGNQAQRLAWALAPLRMIPIRQFNEVFVVDVMTMSPAQAAAAVHHFEASWDVQYPGNHSKAA